MIKVNKNHSLKHHNTFGVEASAKAFASPSTLDEIRFLLEYTDRNALKMLVIGEGSNLLFLGDYDGMVLEPSFSGIECLDESGSEVLVSAGAGENWDHFVAYCVDRGWYGTENLSLIPGTVGSAPVQNIGAYGVEAREIVEHLEVVDITDGNVKTLSNQDCMFGYRSSIFKYSAKGRYIITRVLFRLQKNKMMNLDYGNVKEEFEKSGQKDLASLRNVIIRIRESKLPSVAVYGNAGSFFKNPVIPSEKLDQLKEIHDQIPQYPAAKGVKVPAAWLIDRCGLKGYREGSVGTWPGQPLVIVNYGGASGKQIFEFSEKIRTAVRNRFGIELEREVQTIE